MVNSFNGTFNDVFANMGMQIKLFAAALALFGLTLLGASPVGAASPNAGKDVSYSYAYQTLTNPDGTTSTYHIIGEVDYTKSGNTITATTNCAYFKSPTPTAPPTQATYDGQYNVDGAIADTSYTGVKNFCVENFNNRYY